MPAAPQKPTVFISYAHESDELRTAVKALAHWLEENGCDVLTDHQHENAPSEEGWPMWMQGGISKADVVLIVCTPKLKARFEGSASPDEGHGVTWERTIVTQQMYNSGMLNKKFFPVLPDGGSLGNIPDTLKPWWNKHFFPSGQPGILKLIFEVWRRKNGLPEEPAPSSPAVFIFGSPDQQLSDPAASARTSLIHEMNSFLESEFDRYVLDLGDGWNQSKARLDNKKKIRERFRERDHKVILTSDSVFLKNVADYGHEYISEINDSIDQSFPDAVKSSDTKLVWIPPAINDYSGEDFQKPPDCFSVIRDTPSDLASRIRTILGLGVATTVLFDEPKGEEFEPIKEWVQSGLPRDIGIEDPYPQPFREDDYETSARLIYNSLRDEEGRVVIVKSDGKIELEPKRNVYKFAQVDFINHLKQWWNFLINRLDGRCQLNKERVALIFLQYRNDFYYAELPGPSQGWEWQGLRLERSSEQSGYKLAQFNLDRVKDHIKEVCQPWRLSSQS